MPHSLFKSDPANLSTIETSFFGNELLLEPLLNKGTAFNNDERAEFELHGLLPTSITRLEDQISRRIQVLNTFETDLEKYVFMRELQDNNETLFYAVLNHYIEELLPIIYTPTVGEGCQHFSRLFRKPRGIYLSYPLQEFIEPILSNSRFNQVEVIVVTDGERILGLGDQGAGGMGIPIGKLSLYTACAGIHPVTTLPILLDVGTNNNECLADPIYIGWRHERIRGKEYDQFIDRFVSAVIKRFPGVLLQWEDFAKNNANRLLSRYRNQLCTFNDDIQGTAAVALGTLLSASSISQTPFIQNKIVIFGAGSAGLGIAKLIVQAMIDEGVSEQAAYDKIYLIDKDGLLIEDVDADNGGKSISPSSDASEILQLQKPFRKKLSLLENWTVNHSSKNMQNEKQNKKKFLLFDVIKNLKPTVLIGVSGQGHAFTQDIIQTMANHVARPIIFPLSNPSSQAEATPEEIYNWTKGKAIISTGSPFPAIEREGKKIKFDQTNNSYIFPGLGLAAVALKIVHIPDSLFMAAAKALANTSPASRNNKTNLLPSVNELRRLSFHVALAVAEQAYKEGLCSIPNLTSNKIEDLIRSKIWEPRYLPYKRIAQS